MTPSTSTPPADQDCICMDCGEPYQITGGEAQFYLDKGLKLPRRCANCRKKRKAARNMAPRDHGGYGEHQVPGVHEENVPMNGASDFL